MQLLLRCACERACNPRTIGYWKRDAAANGGPQGAYEHRDGRARDNERGKPNGNRNATTSGVAGQSEFWGRGRSDGTDRRIGPGYTCERLRVGCPRDRDEGAVPSEQTPSDQRWKGNNHVAVGDGFQDLLGDEIAKGRLALRVAGGTETALLAREAKHYGLHLFIPS